MHTELLLARQPILDKEERIYGYELLYRSSHSLANQKFDDMQATSHTLMALLHSVDFDDLLMGKKGFINVDAKMLSTQILELLPKEQFVIEVLESVDLTSAKPLLQKARKEGWSLALDDFICNASALKNLEKFIELFDIIKFDMLDPRNDPSTIAQALGILRRYGVRALAEKVESQKVYHELKELGFELFQGYYFAKPQLHATKTINPTKLKILEILAIDPNQTDRIVQALKEEPDLALGLLRLINSSFFALRRPISSVRQALLYLGVDNLRKWLLLMLYAKNEPDPNNNALLQSAKIRAQFMSKAAKECGLDGEKAYLSGILSLVESILGMPTEEVIAKMPFLDKEVETALLGEENAYAKLLHIAQALERGEFYTAKESAKSLGLGEERLAQLYYEALRSKAL